MNHPPLPPGAKRVTFDDLRQGDRILQVRYDGPDGRCLTARLNATVMTVAGVVCLLHVSDGNPCGSLEPLDRFVSNYAWTCTEVYAVLAPRVTDMNLPGETVAVPQLPMGAKRDLVKALNPVDRNRFPHTCPRCGDPAWVSPILGTVDCSSGRGCR